MEAQLEPWLQDVLGEPVRVLAVEPLPGGACQDNHRLELEPLAQPGARRRLVLRSDAPTKLPGSLDRAQELAVIEAARAAGVQTPRARGLRQDVLRQGAASYVLDWVEGVAIGRQVVQAPELASARSTLSDTLASELGKIHSVTKTTHPTLIPSRVGWQDPATSDDPVSNTLAALRATLDDMPEPHPALEWAFDWLLRHPPARSELVLVHGDFRTGNFMLTPEGLAGILDWEFAHWGQAEEDLAWISVRDWRFGVLDKPIGGFAERASFYEAYERASGRRVDREAVHYWEVWGNVHWAAGCVYQGERYRSGQSTDLEFIAIARRAAEMEYEALRLIQKGAR